MIFRKYKTIIAISIALSICCAHASFSNSKLSNHDYFLSLEHAERNLSAEGLFKLAHCYAFGIGTKKNLEKAFPLLERASEQGSSNALNLLGILYRDGLGVEKDNKQALNYFYKAAMKDNMLAEYNLGMYFYKGRRVGRRKIVDRDYAKAAYWLKSSADKGHHYAQTQLGICYYEGDGLSKIDYVKAAHLFQLASNQGNVLGTYYLARCYEHGNGVDQNKEKAFDLYYKASSQHGARFPYLTAYTNMVADQIYILLVIINILIGLRYPWVAPIPPSTSWPNKERLYFAGRCFIAWLPAACIATLFSAFIGFWEEDKLFKIITPFFYALFSIYISRFEKRKRDLNSK